jgi:hypothetical protein
MPYDLLAPPQQNRGILDPTTAALLQAGFAGLAASGPQRRPVGLGQVAGQAGQAGLGAYQAAEKQQLAQQMLAAKAAEEKRLHDAQIGDLEAKAEQRRQETALQKEQSEYLERPEVQAAIKAGNIAGVLSGMPKLSARDLSVLKPDKDTQHADPQIIQLMKQRDALPQGHPNRAILDAAIKKASEHQAPLNVFTGGLTEGVDAAGNRVFIQPSGRADTPPRIVAGVKPPPPKATAADVKEERDKAALEATTTSVRNRIKAMQDKLQSNAYIVGIGGAARRGVEAVGGIAVPDMPTPALDYQNDLRLLLADVRKVIEKDPNLSNQERQNLYETLGGGTFQTPGSAFRTLNNVLEYMENKKMTGPSRDANLEGAVKAAGWAFEPDKYEYRVVEGKVQRRAKGK